VVLAEVQGMPATAVTRLDGTPLGFEITVAGLRIELDALPSSDRPIGLALHHVEAR